MKRFFVVAVVVVGAYAGARVTSHKHPIAPPTAPAAPSVVAPSTAGRPWAASSPSVSDNASIARAFANRAQDLRVDGEGVVSRLLPDDNHGDRHQRFLVRLPSGQMVLIVHNIAIAPRIQNLRVGGEVTFEGEYIWNDKGGLVHWTHHDPSGRHKEGWIKYSGRTYR